MNEILSPWKQAEITLSSAGRYANPYIDVEVHARFIHSGGAELARPAFWDGGNT